VVTPLVTPVVTPLVTPVVTPLELCKCGSRGCFHLWTLLRLGLGIYSLGTWTLRLGLGRYSLGTWTLRLGLGAAKLFGTSRGCMPSIPNATHVLGGVY